MRVLKIIDEDFTNYREPAMFIGTIQCGGKCCIEAGIPLCVCHNDQWRHAGYQDIPDETICERYIGDPITSAIVFGGLEPFEQFPELIHFISVLRNNYHVMDDIVIYTGYNAYEILDEVNQLRPFGNIVIKYGRYVPDQPYREDPILGVKLASFNQYAERIDPNMKIIVNPQCDPAHVHELRKAMKENGGFCPCSLIHDENTKCMCKEFREQKSGVCHCGLYMKVEGDQHES